MQHETLTLTPAAQALGWRYWSKVNLTGSGCWEWGAARNRGGYGLFRKDGSSRLAHRVMAEACCERELPRKELACHTCDNPRCVNPSHLFVGSDLDNRRDMARKERSCCKLSAGQVLEIRERRASGEPTQSIATRFSVQPETVCAICMGKTWKHVGGPRTVGRYDQGLTDVRTND